MIVDQELVRRLWELDDQILQRFLLAVQGDNDQWYWTGIENIERPAWGIIVLHGFAIPFHFAQTLYGMETYDDNGRLVSVDSFYSTVPICNGDRFLARQRFYVST